MTPAKQSPGQLALQHLFSTAAEREAVAARFWVKVDRSPGAGACWPWLGARRSNGYPHFWLGSHNTTVSAGPVALILSGATPKAGLFGCHHCDNPPCCNPEHLYFGTALENARDAKQRDRFARYPRMAGADHASSRLTPEQVGEIRKRFKPGAGAQDIAKAFGVSLSHVYGICNGQAWRHMKTPERPGSPSGTI